MEGQRNHKYFKNQVINIEKAYIEAKIYHLDDYNCPSIVLGPGKVYGEVITYKDLDGEIEAGLDMLEGNFEGNLELCYKKEKVDVYVGGAVKSSQVYILENIDNMDKKEIKELKLKVVLLSNVFCKSKFSFL